MLTLAGNNLSTNTPDASQFKFGFMSSLEEPWEAVELMVSSLGGGCSDWRELFLHDALNVHTDESLAACAVAIHELRVLKRTRTPSSAWCSLLTTDRQAAAAAAAAAFIASLIALTLLCKTHPWLLKTLTVYVDDNVKKILIADSRLAEASSALHWRYLWTPTSLLVGPEEEEKGGGAGGGDSKGHTVEAKCSIY